MRIGIFFGGPSREREVSFAGGRTVFDNLNKDLFTPIPIFVDSMGQFILLEWPYIYKGTIRDFYPPSEIIPEEHRQFQHYIESFPELAEEAANQIGSVIPIDQLPEYIEFAFLALHGRYGEDGTLQAQLQNLGIPYSGSGVMACAIGMDKYAQKSLMASAGFTMPQMIPIKRTHWLSSPQAILDEISESFLWHFPAI
jgi:D-alanine-D-alanine ligase